jgi:mono/diheme cytochrome c family protein
MIAIFRCAQLGWRRVTRAGLGLLLVIAVTATPGISPAQPLFSSTQDPVAGERLFSAKGCAACHAVNGVGGKVGPDLGRAARPRTFFDLAAALWNHTPKMAERMRQAGMARARLDGRETGDLIAYLYTLNYFDRAGDATAGRRVFADKQCAHCHAIADKGGGIGPDLGTLGAYASPIAIAAAMWNHGPRMTAAMSARGIARPAFEGSQLLDLIAYLKSASARPKRTELYVLPGSASNGRLLFADKRCVVCHPITRRGDEEGPDLVEGQAQRSLTQFAAAMWNKAPAMLRAMEARQISPPTFRPDEMADIVAYLYSVRYFRSSGRPREGVLVAVNKGCLDCHGLYGEKGKSASDLDRARSVDTPAGALAALWNHSFVDDPRPERERRPWPTLRADEMADLMAYLRSIARGR